MINKSLTELANYHGTDKGTVGPSDAWSSNNYTDVYDSYLSASRYAHLNVLEIGLGVTGDQWEAKIVHGRNSGGASIKMWHDYFPNAKIYGLDINACPYLNNDRTKTFVADQGRVEDLESFMEQVNGIEFDHIFDDGSHRPDHQQISLNYFFRKLKSGGLYFIEDLFSNGQGDGTSGRMCCDDVKNTRNILQNFRMYGEFLRPNGFTNETYLKENIESLTFHSPKIDVTFALGLSFKNIIKKQINYQPNSERICAIKKR